MSTNSRSYFRLTFEQPLYAECKIIGVSGASVESRKSPICVLDLSANGLRCLSRLMLPADSSILLEFRFVLLDKEIKILGTIVRRKPLRDGLFEYAIVFSAYDHEMDALSGLINIVAAKLRKTKVLSSCSFCTPAQMEEITGSSVGFSS
ncbi:PilZ domain-containing protein [Paenibacillus cymbidii]|uniref:PilZ domain-containing protein n=1 Tax=Paenibacillus cymbidii TaxID=1639034 RepID=UPI0014369511|nr:PilZ domain-containing protein [Paenibacillus cymbidii]